MSEDLKLRVADHLKKKEFQEILGLYHPVNQVIATRDMTLIYMVGLACYHLMLCDEAEELLGHVVDNNPSQYVVLELIIKILTAYGHYDRVLAYVHKYPDAFANNISCAYNCIYALLMSERAEEFFDYYEYIRNQMHSEAVSSLSGQLLALLDQPQLAEKCFDHVIKQSTEETNSSRCLKFHMDNKPGVLAADLRIDLLGKFQNKINQSWLNYQLARTHDMQDDMGGWVQEKPTFPIEQGAFSYNPIPTQASVMLKNSDGLSPVEINEQRFENGLQTYRLLVEKMNANGMFDVQMSNIKAVREKYASEKPDPIFVLSTGRCGTTALKQLTDSQDDVLSYHSYQWQMKSGDMNHVLYRVIMDDFSSADVEKIILEFVKARTSEIIYAYGNGCLPIFTGHWDTIFAPIWAVLFPDSRFIYLHRDNQAVIKSAYLKNQYFNNQLQYLIFDDDFERGKFNYAYAPDIPLIRHLCWFHYITRIFATSFEKLVPDGQYFDLKSEDMFTGDNKGHERLSEFLSIDGVNADKMRAHFAEPINAKEHRNVGQSVEVQAELDKVPALIQELWQNGKFATA